MQVKNQTAEQSRSTWQVFSFFSKYIRKHAGRLAVAGGAMVAAAVMSLARPWPMKFIFDYVLFDKITDLTPPGVLENAGPLEILALACASVIAVAILFGSFEYVQTISAATVGQKIIYSLRSRLYTHVQRLSLSYHTRTHTGDLLSRLLREVNQLRNFLTESALQLASESFLASGLIVVMFWLNWRLALMSLAVFPLVLWAIVHFSGAIRGHTRRRLRKESEVASMFADTLAAIQEVHLFGGDDGERNKFKSENRSSYRAELRAAKSKGRLMRVVEILAACGLCAVLWFGARDVMSGAMTPGDLLVFVSYLRTLFKPVRRVARLSVQASKAVASAERVIEVLETEPEIQDSPDAIEAPPFKGAIEFRDVNFSYEQGRQTLFGINLKLEAGSRLVLLGPSGVGKSTLVSLIPRLYDPDSGQVLIDGADVRDFTMSSLREQISVVPQEAALFSGSCRDNIAYANPAADDRAIQRAARLACADEFIEKLPDGYDTEIGENGARLSGGQRQRLAIARAMLRNTPIVILDEPMKGVDLEAEGQILKALDNLLHERTACIIAHRLSTLFRADIVVVLDKGGILECGSPRSLYGASGRFREFAEMQFNSDQIAEYFGSQAGGAVH